MMISGGFDGESGSETECSLLCFYQRLACGFGLDWLHQLIERYTVPKAWSFDEKTGDGVILYEDGSAYIADIFTTAEELYQYAGNEGSK